MQEQAMSSPDPSSPLNNTATQAASPPPPLISPPPPSENSSAPPSPVTPVSSNSSSPPPVSPSPPLLSPPPPSNPPPVPDSGPPQASSSPPSPSNSKAPPPSPPASSSGATSSPPPPPSPYQSPPPSGGQPSQPAPNVANPTPGPGSPQLSPPPPLSNTPLISVPSPVIPAPGLPQANSPPPPLKLSPPSAFGVAPPPSSTSSTNNLRPPSKSAKSPPTESESNGNTGTAIAAGMAGVFLIGIIAFIFVASNKRKRRREIVHAPHYVAPTNFSMQSDGNYYVQQQTISNSGLAEGFYSQAPLSFMNTYGSQIPNAYNGGGAESGVISNSKTHFSYEELMEITQGFSRQNVLGEGGFGCVYKGWLPDGKVVAVKMLKAGSGQGEREFRAEVEIISRVHHRHLVSLVGYCISEQNRLLIYEFVPNKTLEHHLHGLEVLDWSKRLKIALGSAKGLAYLHEDCHPKIIHRDIKSANILLDDAFEAQVADFGLAKLTNDTSTHVSTRVMGTFGYMAPEYASSGKLTDRSDVFSFGVVLLELITGRKPVDTTQPLGDESLVEWARPLLIDALETLDFGELVDPRLERRYVENEMVRMIEAAAACIRHSAPKRPRMAQVVRALDTESERSDISNGVKFGQSTMYDSGQYNKDISRFRKMALELTKESSEYELCSGEYNSRDFSQSTDSSIYRDGSGSESETRAFNLRSSNRRYIQHQLPSYDNGRDFL